MRKPFNTIINTTACAALLFATNAMATVFTIEDTWVNWPGYSGSTQTEYVNQDEINNPQIDKMLVTVENNSLKKVDILLRSNERVLFDSLFINTSWDSSNSDSWDDWDHFVHAGGTTSESNASGDVPLDGLYEVSSDYDYTTVSSGGRFGNPDGIDEDSLFNRTDFDSVFDTSYSMATDGYEAMISYDFGSGLFLSGGFFVAYAPYCANDVIGGGAPVPEPATMLLFGAGLTCLAGYRVRSKRK